MANSKGGLWRLPAVIVVSLAALTGSFTPTLSDLLWQPYVDPALGYSILYPSGLFDLPPVHEHGGITLGSSSGAKQDRHRAPGIHGRIGLPSW